MIYLDTGILVRACLEDHPQFPECDSLISMDALSSCHSLAETFSTLTGFYKMQNDQASELVEDLAEQMTFKAIGRSDYLNVIRQSRNRGIQGGIIYDAVHAHIARSAGVKSIYTYNVSNFRHVASDLAIASPSST